jgi:hypothetical protein
MGFLYINGVLVASGPQMIPATVTRTEQWVARSAYAGDAFFAGSMEELHVWSTVRSGSQIQMDMNQLTGDEPGLVAYYPLDEASGSTAFDRTANHYDATLTSTGTGDQPAWVADAGPGPGRVVASFTSADPAARPSDFTVMIDWGDGHSSAGIVTVNGQGGFNVSGSNIYLAPGTYTITVTVTDTFGGIGTGHGTANVLGFPHRSAAIHRQQDGIQVNAGAMTGFYVSGYPSGGSTFEFHTFTVMAIDAFGNQVTNYSGKVHLSSDDALLPEDYAFTDADAGMHVFTTAFQTAGTHCLRAVDVAMGSWVGEEDDIVVV